MGEFNAENTAYSQGRGDYDRLTQLQSRSNICTAITAVCGVWAAVELVRYLWAADRVLPAKTKIDKKAEKFNIEDVIPVITEQKEEPLDSSENQESFPATEITVEEDHSDF